MKKFIIQSILLLLVIVFGMYFYVKEPDFLFPFIPTSSQVNYLKINNSKIQVEIADTQEKRSKGLGGRESLASDSGMLFVFEKADKYPFWMKGLKFALDFVWINEEKVVDILENIKPPQPGSSDEALQIYTPKVPADKVLEVAAGTVQRLNIKVGDIVTIGRE